MPDNESLGLPVQSAGMSPLSPGGQTDVVSQIVQALRNPNIQFHPSAQGTPAIIGGPPPNVAQPVPVPGVVPMTQYQAGGPSVREGPSVLDTGGLKVGRGADRAMAIAGNAIRGLDNNIRQYKQQKFESEAATTAEIMSRIINGKMAHEKMQNGGQLSAEDINHIAGAMNMSPQVMKLLEKAQKDPMSGAYAGIQRAYAGFASQQTQQAALEEQRAKTQQALSASAKNDAEALFWRDFKPVIEQGKVDAKIGTAYANIVSENMQHGIHTEWDPEHPGDLNHLIQRPYTQEEIDADPTLRTQQRLAMARTDAAIEQAKKDAVSPALAREKMAMQWKIAQLRDRRAAERNAIEREKGTQAGQKLSPREQDRMDLANIASDYVNEMLDIVDKRPELFGKAGWGQNAFAKAVADQDSDAIRFSTLATLTAAPIGAAHVRSARVVKQMDDLNSSFYKSPESVKSQLDTELRAMQAMASNAGRTTHFNKETGKIDAGSSEEATGNKKPGGPSITIGQGKDAVTINIPE